MKTRTSKRVLTLVLAIVLTFVLAVSAFATWSSFQGRNTNNGTIPTQPAIAANPTVTAVPLTYNDPGYMVYTGVDAASVIQGNYAFTLYNGGVTNGTAGGARMQATNMAATDPTVPLWNIQLDTDASNANQLSTPYYDSCTNTIYAAVTYTTALNNYTSLSDWTASGGAAISNGTATFTGGNQAVSTSITLTAPVHTIYLPTNLGLDTADAYAGYTVTLSDGTNTYTLANSTAHYSSWPGTYDTYNGAQIPARTYTLTITVNSISTGNATLSTVSLSRYDWRLYSISSANTSSPVLSSVLASGEGQINTHINAIGNYLFFGGFGGDHSYYQYGPINGTASLIAFTPATQEDFYYAGASKVSANSTSEVVFGSESGKVYVRPVGATFGSAAGSVIDLASTQPACGPIRSSICVVGSDWYLTSRGSGSNGYLWRIDGGTTVNQPLVLTGNSTSTPVVSDNGYVYVGYSVGYASGAVVAVPADFTYDSPKTTIYSGDPVQCSPIAYSNDNGDYVYFTTNAYLGAGYCYCFDGSVGTQVWTAGGSSANRYAVQGFSSENGYLIYGDDGDSLYIIH